MEPLKIEAEKIIPILLKHLMVLKNENAFMKNNAAIYLLENDIPRKEIDKKSILDEHPENKVGAKNANYDHPEKRVDTKLVSNEYPENRIGANIEIDEHPEKMVDAKNEIDEYPENKDGAKNEIDEYQENKVGINSIFKSFPPFNEAGKDDFPMYSIFEKELLTALEQYIKSDDGQKTLYTFYSNFANAIDERNVEAKRIEESKKIVRLEDTHVLPDFIQIDLDIMDKLIAALSGYLPRTARRDMYRNVAFELLFLYNEKKCTANDLRQETGLSVTGFKKHLSNLIRCGLLQKQPPLNYVLTETTKHLLLKLFGIPKTN